MFLFAISQENLIIKLCLIYNALYWTCTNYYWVRSAANLLQMPSTEYINCIFTWAENTTGSIHIYMCNLLLLIVLYNSSALLTYNCFLKIYMLHPEKMMQVMEKWEKYGSRLTRGYTNCRHWSIIYPFPGRGKTTLNRFHIYTESILVSPPRKDYWGPINTRWRRYKESMSVKYY